jgi:hypothetical protein
MQVTEATVGTPVNMPRLRAVIAALQRQQGTVSSDVLLQCKEKKPGLPTVNMQ